MDQEKVYLENAKASIVTAQELSDFDIPKESERSEDLLYVKFKLAHASVNLNKDGFFEDDLRDRHSTIVGKCFNDSHNPEKIIGHVVASRFVEASSDEPSYVEAIGVIYKYQLKKVAKKIQEDFAKGEFFVSMECWHKSVYCPICDKEQKSNAVCSHIKNRATIKDAVRYFKDYIFAGVAYCRDKNPADESAVALALASQGLDSFYELISNHYPAKEVIEFYNKLKNDELSTAEEKDFNKHYQISLGSPYRSIEEVYNLFSCANLEDNIDRIKTLFGNENVGGEIMADKTYTQAEHDKAVEEAVKIAVASVQEDKKNEIEISDLKGKLATAEAKVTETEGKLTKVEAEKLGLETAIATANQKETERLQAETEKATASTRVTELKAKGFTIPDTFASKLGKMSAEDYTDYVTTLESNKTVAAAPGIAVAAVEDDSLDAAWEALKKGKK